MKYSKYIGFLQSRPLKNALDYWEGYLAQLVPCHFPILNDDVPELNELHEVKISLEETWRLHNFCRKYNLTPASVFQTAWAFVLKAYTNMNDVCFGYLSAGRDAPIPDIGDTVGVYINMLVCRLRIDSTKKVVQLVEEVQAMFLEALPHQYCSLFNTVMSLQSALGEGIWGTRPGEGVGFKIVGEYDPTEVNASCTALSIGLG